MPLIVPFSIFHPRVPWQVIGILADPARTEHPAVADLQELSFERISHLRSSLIE